MTSRPTAFEQLTETGRLRRLRALALEALRAYDLEVARCSYLARAFNTVFRIDATDGTTYALRMSPALRIHADGCEEAEATWLSDLRRDDRLRVPRVIRARDGSAVVWVSSAGVPEARSCVLFEWVGGRRLRDRISAEPVRKTGELTAAVHEHAATHPIDRPRGVLVADRVLYFRAAERLEELRPTYGTVLSEAVERAQLVLDELWRDPPHAPHLLHGDVHPGNVMVDRGDVVLIDFQDLIWGFDLHDVGIAMLWFDQSGDGTLGEEFRAGYETVRPWPSSTPSTEAALRAARNLNILNFGLSMRRPGLDEFIARKAVPVVEWMRG